MGWWSVRGSVRISSRGSSYIFWIWLVNVPGSTITRRLVNSRRTCQSRCGRLDPVQTAGHCMKLHIS